VRFARKGYDRHDSPPLPASAGEGRVSLAGTGLFDGDGRALGAHTVGRTGPQFGVGF
jgi:hypothetical protein